MQNTKKHLSARQVVNRYKKEFYTDECANIISAAISSSQLGFNSVAIPVQTCWVDEVLENIEMCFQLCEHREEKDSILSSVSDERVKAVLSDLAIPDVWNIVCGKVEMSNALIEYGLLCKYPLRNRYSVLDAAFHSEKDRIAKLGLDYTKLLTTLSLMFRSQKD